MNMMVISKPSNFAIGLDYQLIKRGLDIILSVLLLPVLAPVMLVCALAIYLDSAGPIFFIQDRVGKGGRHFRIYKFRTMLHQVDDSSHRAFMKAFVRGQIGGASGPARNEHQAFVRAFVEEPALAEAADAPVYKPASAAHITRVGRLLRKTSLDELPQIINVIRGEMSLVGPRPNVPWEVEEYKPWHSERLEVLPGITGLAQVKGRSSISFDSIVNYDIDYIEQQSLAMDLRVLWLTGAAIFRAKGAK